MTPFFSVIIVNFNGGSDLARAVSALKNQSFTDFEAFIVDNGSTDGSVSKLPKLDERFTLIEAGENLGFAAGNNLAALQARGDWIITLNPDAFARPDWLDAMSRGIKRNPGVSLFGSVQMMADDPDRFDGTGDEFHICGIAYRAGYERPARTLTDDYPVFGPCGAAAAYRRDLFEAAGGFDERFFCYHEDVDLALRIRRLGGRAVQIHDAIVDHVGGGTSGRASDFAVYHGTRNRVWTWFSSMPAALMWGLLPFHIVANLAYLIWSLFRPERFKPTVRGLKDALFGLPDIIKSRNTYPKGSGAIWPVLIKNPIRVLHRRNRIE